MLDMVSDRGMHKFAAKLEAEYGPVAKVRVTR
jgi:hypothetical protein